MTDAQSFVVWDPRLKVVSAQSRQEALLVAQARFAADEPSTGDLMVESLDELSGDLSTLDG